MKKIMCTGTFDLLHKGHIKYLEQAKQEGDFLIVVIARDVNVTRTKGNTPHDSEEQRLKNVQNIPIVDKAVLGHERDIFRVVEEEQPDIICLGYDQRINESVLQQSLAKRGLYPKIKRMQAYQPDVYKSSKIRANIMKEEQNKA